MPNGWTPIYFFALIGDRRGGGVLKRPALVRYMLELRAPAERGPNEVDRIPGLYVYAPSLHSSLQVELHDRLSRFSKYDPRSLAHPVRLRGTRSRFSPNLSNCHQRILDEWLLHPLSDLSPDDFDMLQCLCDFSFLIPTVLVSSLAELGQALLLLYDFSFKRPQKYYVLFAGIQQNRFSKKIVQEALPIVDVRELRYGPSMSRAGTS